MIVYCVNTRLSYARRRRCKKSCFMRRKFLLFFHKHSQNAENNVRASLVNHIYILLYGGGIRKFVSCVSAVSCPANNTITKEITIYMFADIVLYLREDDKKLGKIWFPLK